jgi:Alw26I/Eco31I/Esp3I family type II restriction m6 adenine DNA methyltransferase
MPIRHLDLLRDRGGVDSLGRSLFDRAAGRFYTPELIGKRLVRAAVRSLDGYPHPIRVVDPFCGDGRLVVWLLGSVRGSPTLRAAEWEIELWDMDADAVFVAKQQVTLAAKQAGINALVRSAVVDTFEHAPSRFGAFNIVLTNPPWDVLKPDKRELAALAEEEATEYVKTLRAHSDQLVALYPTSLPRLRFSGWGVNLARCGVEAALRLTTEEGVCGVVSPASLLADQASAELRRWMLESFHLTSVDYFPAETRLFEGVDQPSIALVAVPGGRTDMDVAVSRFGPNRDAVEHSRYTGDVADLEPAGFSLPIHVGKQAAQIIARIRQLPRFRELESRDRQGLWAGRELDETNRQSFLSEDGPHPFVKGRMIARYGAVRRPAQGVAANARSIPASAGFPRIAWRDVSRPSQVRRMQATMIPAGWVTGNSLSVAYFRDGDDQRLKALLAVLNSAVFECQVRAHLATAHVSLSTVRICHVPRLDRTTTESLAKLVDCRLEGDESVEEEIDHLVATSYGVVDELDAIRALLVRRSAVDLEVAS